MNELTLTATSTNGLTMSSREIAELCEKQHKHVLRDIEIMLSGLEIDGKGYAQNWTNPQNGQKYPEFLLPKDLTLTLVAGYNIKLRKRIIDRWIKLEEQTAKPQFAIPQTLSEALRLAADLAEQKAIVEQQRDVAIATKALIGSQREATAMNTASQAVKKVGRLEQQLDRSRLYATVKRMQMLYHGQAFNWRLLKATANQMNLPPIDVFDANYGTVKAYHAAVWREAYAVEIDQEQFEEAA